MKRFGLRLSGFGSMDAGASFGSGECWLSFDFLEKWGGGGGWICQ